jgi:hypothetical protein
MSISARRPRHTPPRRARQRASGEVDLNRLAKINFSGGTRLMPARNRYDRELVFEEAEFCARRHGSITLELGDAAIHIDRALDEQPHSCASCSHAIGSLVFFLADRILCSRCARQTRLS